MCAVVVVVVECSRRAAAIQAEQQCRTIQSVEAIRSDRSSVRVCFACARVLFQHVRVFRLVAELIRANTTRHNTRNMCEC